MAKTEAEKFSDIDSLFDFILKVQDRMAPKIVSNGEAREGEHRKGVILIHGDKDWVRVFEVSGGRLVMSQDLEDVRTLLEFRDVNTFIICCKEVLGGRTSTFARAKARGDVRVKGEHALRDGVIFNRLLGKIGKVLAEYNVTFGD